MHRTAPGDDAVPVDVDVAVIGGGLAGLAAAARLQAGGRKPVVFEATDRVGGRQRSTELAGEVLEEGAVFFGSNYPTLREYLARTGLDAKLVSDEAIAHNTLGVGEAINDSPSALIRSAHIPWTETCKAVAFGISLRLKTRRIMASLGNPTDTALARRLDRIDAQTYLRRWVGPQFVGWRASPFLEALGFAPAHDWSALGALQLLVFAGMSQLWGIESGNSRLAERIASDVEVELGERVTSLDPSPAGVRLELTGPTGATRTIECRDVVLAVPAPVAAELLSGALREAVERFHYSSSVVIAVALRALDVELPATSIFGGPGGYRHISGMVAEQSRPGAPVISYGALRHPVQYEVFDSPDDEIVPILTRVLEEANGSALDVIDQRVVRWKNSVPVTVPGSLGLRRAARHLAAEQPHLYLAGDWLVSPSQEGALVSGHKAADALLGR
jgi:oxygen-dependent protoporphyrinogen oxidase